MKLRSDKIKAGTMALAAAFSLNALMPSYVEARSAPQPAPAPQQIKHPLLQDVTVRGKYMSSLSLALVKATGENKARLRTADFVANLEAKL